MSLTQMSPDRANWDHSTISLLVELVSKQKDLCHWADKGPTTIGWTNVSRAFNETTQLGYPKKKLQNKFNELKRAGQLVSAGGHRSKPTASGDSPQSPHEMSEEPIEPPSAGQTSKRPFREHSVCSPRKKSSQTPTLDDCLDDLDDIIKVTRGRKSHRIIDAEEIAKVNQILKEDGYNERDLFFAQALNVCTNRIQRRAFLDLKSKEGRWNFVNVTWDVMTQSPSDLKKLYPCMDSNEESTTSDTSSDSQEMKNLAKAGVILRRIKAILAMQPPVVNPPAPIPKLTGAQING
ncbi:hypothetical protein C2845_PM07G14680 [Panicum miliaceum]|uniref:Myb/SANT-like domain-containing protein n=1 Tax=Panicum miliaceum TaxID=4540 RepID=A0A3L6SN52_PANMI|nr:hypothetical protein C2845_PM07G14680 [Panicum miliaceum]